MRPNFNPIFLHVQNTRKGIYFRMRDYTHGHAVMTRLGWRVYELKLSYGRWFRKTVYYEVRP